MARRIGGLDGEQRRAARREALLDAALDLFARQGYLGTSIEQLCQEAHVSTKSFYDVFTSREDCYLGLMRRSTVHLQTVVGQALEGAPADDESAAAAVVLNAMAHAFGDDPRHAIVLFGHGTATTVDVERERRTNRRWAAEFVAGIWRQYSPDVPVPPGLATGTSGGLFDIVADWVTDVDGPPALDVDELHGSLRAFYGAVVAGRRLSYGKDFLS
ncbi:TetR/AcrR family transcriptional regulator [Luteipulveratus mongoliensis]|uniref:TetR/AcrR family transcriptional regulator n=1 Tax=Luteipulveratus mongoliensis TaxID=571913 RepID=UPI0014704F65|nr:TetR/AcrR family transcriptional regulator [Luteipulveratus mongoliensis]